MAHTAVGTINMDMYSYLQNGKVIVELELTDGEIAGIQSRLKYDPTVLFLEEVIFDTGNTLTNFSRSNNSELIFGSLATGGEESIKSGKVVKVVFDTLEQVTNTTGLFYFHNTDAVKMNGDKLILNIQ